MSKLEQCQNGTNKRKWTETSQSNAPRYLIGRSVGDTGRLGQKYWKTDFVILLLLCL
jgi:hypothetical protein